MFLVSSKTTTLPLPYPPVAIVNSLRRLHADTIRRMLIVTVVVNHTIGLVGDTGRVNNRTSTSLLRSFSSPVRLLCSLYLRLGHYALALAPRSKSGPCNTRQPFILNDRLHVMWSSAEFLVLPSPAYKRLQRCPRGTKQRTAPLIWTPLKPILPWGWRVANLSRSNGVVVSSTLTTSEGRVCLTQW